MRTPSLIALVLLLLAPAAAAQKQGFQLNRYEPTAPGEGTLLVDHPWYAGTRYLAAGLTLNYAHDPLVLGRVAPDGTFHEAQTVIGHQFLMHLDVAGSLLDRVTLGASLPVTLLERGEAAFGVEPVLHGTVGDPRLSAMVRLLGQPDRDLFSLSLGAWVWIPLRKFTDSLPQQASDQEVRALPKIVSGGVYRWLRWSATLGFLFREDATLGTLGNPTGSSVGSAVQLGAAAYYHDTERRLSVGPELLLGTTVTGGHGFQRDYTGLELLLGGHYHLLRLVHLGLGLGLGALREPGTPDFRLLFRMAYAPVRSPKPRPAPRPAPRPEPKPAPPQDRDLDRVPDAQDLCPDEPAGAEPDETRPGCPARDRDRDGVMDHRDACPDVPAGLHPDPARPGCPLPDRDGDGVVDEKDACPDKPGAPSPDPKRNGCPGLVKLEGGQLRILQPVFFATDRDVILPKSYPVLQAVADALRADPAIKKMAIEGHTDSRGPMQHNADLSARRARSVLRFLVERGVAPERLVAQGYGPLRPIQSNATAAGRAANRRVEFRILDPAVGASLQPAAPGSVQAPEPTDGPAREERPKPKPAQR